MCVIIISNEPPTVKPLSYKEGQFPEEDPNKPYFPSSADNFKIPIFVIWNVGLLLIIYLLFVSPVTRSYVIKVS